MLMYTCVGCNIEMTCVKNEVALVHFLDNDRKKGIDVVRFGDKWQCPKCGSQVVAGLGQRQIMGFDLTDPKKFLDSCEIIEVKR